MKPKQQTNNDAIGEEALRLLTESGTVVSGVGLADMHAAKKARKQRLKEVITAIWNGFEQGLSFNGYDTKEEWAEKFAKITIRHIQHIVYGRKTAEANNCSPEWRVYLDGSIIVEPRYAVADVTFELPYENPGGNAEFYSYRNSNGDLRVVAHYAESDEETGRKLLFQELTNTLKALRLPKISWKKFLNDFDQIGETPATRKAARSESAKRGARTRARRKGKDRSVKGADSGATS